MSEPPPFNQKVHVRRQEEGTYPFPTRPATRRRKSAPAGAQNITHGLGGSLVQSTSLTVISSNPTPLLLLYYRSSHAFAMANRSRSGNNAWGSKRKSVPRDRSGVLTQLAVCEQQCLLPEIRPCAATARAVASALLISRK